MKKILYINQYFKHPKEPGITRSYWIARRLIDAGYSVTMLAHQNTLLRHVKNVPPVQRLTIDGIDVIYLRNKYENQMGVLARLRSFLSFMFRATLYAVREKDVDLVIATSTPLSVAFPALVRQLVGRTPFVFEVRDLWPEAAIQLGAIRNIFVIRLLRWFERLTYRKACHVVALSPGMRAGVTRYVSGNRTSMIPNMAKIDRFWPRNMNVNLIDEMGLMRDSFKVIYFGQMGVSNGVHVIVDAAKKINTLEENIEFVFVGHGKVKEEVEDRIVEEQIDGIHVFERLPMREISEVVNFCDLSLVTFANVKILETNSPNKLFDSLSAGVPIVVNSAGWTKDLVEQGECGVFVPPDSPEKLAAMILALKDDPERLSVYGLNARRLAEETYDKSVLCDQFLEVIDAVWMKNVETRDSEKKSGNGLLV